MNHHPHKRVETRFPVLPAILDRWSTRSFSARIPATAQLQSLFEAARLAPSAHNTQPSRFLLAQKGQGDAYERLFACLHDHNKVWAHTAPVLILASVMQQRFSQEKGTWVPYSHFMHDLGLAVMSLILQATSLGLSAHPLAAFDADQARAAFAVPPLFEPALIVAVGYIGPSEVLPEALRVREEGPRVRRPLEEIVFEDTWGEAARILAEGKDPP